MKLELVSHCWRYARMLRYQLSSLFLFPPCGVQVQAIVFCTSREHDPDTWTTLDNFLSTPAPPNVAIRPWLLPPEQLFRRGIGRNLAATACEADWVWFADCDMTFREGAFDRLAELVQGRSEPLFYPSEIRIHRSHALGDAAIEHADVTTGLIDVVVEDFVPHRYNRAIGGVQIVPGKIARDVGYCRNTRWQRPAPCWQGAKEDISFRRSLGT